MSMSATEQPPSTQPGSLAQEFDNLGYVVIRGLLNREEVKECIAKLEKLSGIKYGDYRPNSGKEWSMPDGVTRLPDWWPLIFHKRLIATIRGIIGLDARYTQHSDLHVNWGYPGWHRDNAYRAFGKGPDWDESRAPYRIARVAIYLQEHATSGSKLGVIPRSHRQESFPVWLEQKVHNGIKKLLRRSSMVFPLFAAKPVWIATEPGDCVIFNQRILHSSTDIRGSKYSVFLSYGADNEHSRNHRRFYLDRRDHDFQSRPYREFAPELARRLKEENLLLEMA